MARKTSLREFQQNFAKRLHDLSSHSSVSSKLGFQVGSEHYLVTLSDVSEVIPVPGTVAVPQTEPWFKGVANVRGKLYSLVDFSAFQGGAASAAGADRRVMLIHEKIIEGAGILVGRMLGLRNTESFTAEPAEPTPKPWIKQRYRDGNGVQWIELDLANLARNPVFLNVGLSQTRSPLQQ